MRNIYSIGAAALFGLLLSSYKTPTPQVGAIPKKVNLFDLPEKDKGIQSQTPILFVPKKVDLFTPPPTTLTLQPVAADRKILAPFALSSYEGKAAALPALAYSFCGLSIPTNLPQVAQKLGREIAAFQSASYSLYHYRLRASKYQGEIEATLEKNGLPKELFYLAVAESGLANVTSPKGAKGFWQFMPETAKRFQLEVSSTVDERLHPQKSCEAACQYLRVLYQRFGDWGLATAAYNMGEGGVENALKSQGKKDYFSLVLNPETARYLYRIVGIKYLLTQPHVWGMKKEIISSTSTATRIEPVNYSIDNLDAFAQECGTDYATLKALNPWLISDKFYPKSGKIYEICLPVAGSYAPEEWVDR